MTALQEASVPISSPCRFCGTPLRHVFADLGAAPLANSYLRPQQLNQMERVFPLRAFVCERCFLAQLEEFAAPETIFTDYAYFSSYSDTLLAHSRTYVDTITRRLGLKTGDHIVEIASNDGYLLQYFLQQGLDVLGIEPAGNVAKAAIAKGVPTMVRFFGSDLARELVAAGSRPRLLVANNVLGHVPKLNDFIEGLALLLAPGGMITLEFHHLYSLIVGRQFDALYHEHFQYFSLGTAKEVLEAHGLVVVDVEEIAPQGGSLRVYACHRSDASGAPSPNVERVLRKEEAAGLRALSGFRSFGDGILKVKLDLLSFLIDAKRSGKAVVCYGAAAKGNTLLNYCGVRADLVDYAVDKSPHKQGAFLPGSRIPIHHPDKVRETRPDYLLVLPWNLHLEIMAQMSYILEWGASFVVAIPELHILV